MQAALPVFVQVQGDCRLCGWCIVTQLAWVCSWRTALGLMGVLLLHGLAYSSHHLIALRNQKVNAKTAAEHWAVFDWHRVLLLVASDCLLGLGGQEVAAFRGR